MYLLDTRQNDTLKVTGMLKNRTHKTKTKSQKQVRHVNWCEKRDREKRVICLIKGNYRMTSGASTRGFLKWREDRLFTLKENGQNSHNETPVLFLIYLIQHFP